MTFLDLNVLLTMTPVICFDFRDPVAMMIVFGLSYSFHVQGHEFLFELYIVSC